MRATGRVLRAFGASLLAVGAIGCRLLANQPAIALIEVPLETGVSEDVAVEFVRRGTHDVRLHFERRWPPERIEQSDVDVRGCIRIAAQDGTVKLARDFEIALPYGTAEATVLLIRTHTLGLGRRIVSLTVETDPKLRSEYSRLRVSISKRALFQDFDW